ncbi:helix-turn-helix transcriptional regulator [Paenibacillus alvei]|uniref:Helix-turn-helix transcriptional regulator n=1 Tax=Paenibacillus alvei TaxID=44250 RepID=A0ABT4H744_PAEAL|nr:helix-turn-helix transcriptional regulator [Paenibacillus alvei]MCY9764807.1 helix-turn-helix transcriptional regulator [Paenibacillus alvei]MCY9770714.1 helix-turn-helix transcriptional regulator [Paenibacillus alvei]
MNEALVNARKNCGLTISDAAKAIGISHGMLAMLETKKRRGSDETKIKVSKFYGQSIEELFYSH